MNLEPRAEGYSVKALNGLRVLTGLDSLIYYHLALEEKPLLVVGPRGFGKTFAILKLLRERLQNSVVILFKQTGRATFLDPLTMRRVEGESLEERDIIVFDDIHYTCDAIREGWYPEERFVDLLERIIGLTESGKKVILVSDSQLSYYCPLIKDRRFCELSGRVRELFTEPISMSGWANYFEDLGIQADLPSIKLIPSFVHTPRSLVRIAKVFNSEITLRKLVEEIERKTGKKLKFNKVGGFGITHLSEISEKFFEMLPHSVREILPYIEARDMEDLTGGIYQLMEAAEYLKDHPELGISEAVDRFVKEERLVSYRPRMIKRVMEHFGGGYTKYKLALESVEKAAARIREIFGLTIEKEREVFSFLLFPSRNSHRYACSLTDHFGEMAEEAFKEELGEEFYWKEAMMKIMVDRREDILKTVKEGDLGKLKKMLGLPQLNVLFKVLEMGSVRPCNEEFTRSLGYHSYSTVCSYLRDLWSKKLLMRRRVGRKSFYSVPKELRENLVHLSSECLNEGTHR